MSTQQELTPEGVLADIGYDGFVRALFSRSGDLSKDFAHAVLGIATELNELERAHDDVNALEEQGDLTFYCVALVQVAEDIMGVRFTDEQIESFGYYVDELHEQCALSELPPWEFIDDARTDLLNAAKRAIGYGKMPQDLVHFTREALALVNFAWVHSVRPWIDEERVMLANTAKLLERYQGLTFNADRAVNRDTAAERALLEQHAA